MRRKIKIKYWFWAIVVFGMIGIYMPIIVRVFQRSENILILKETVFNVTTYAISILVTAIYSLILKSSDGSESFKSKLMDYIGYIVGSIIYVLFINYIIDHENEQLRYWLSISLSIIGCAVSWRMWFVATTEDHFGTGALGENTY